MGYDLSNDEILMSISPLYYAARAHASDEVRELVELSGTDLSDLSAGNHVLTRRNARSMVMGVYDPLGLVSACLVKGKILLRNLYQGNTTKSWDDDINDQEKKKWSTWFLTLLDSPPVHFPRSTRPKAAVGDPCLVGFCDAAEEAVCAVLYIVWEVQEGPPKSSLLIAKCRVTPLHGATIPQG